MTQMAERKGQSRAGCRTRSRNELLMCKRRKNRDGNNDVNDNVNDNVKESDVDDVKTSRKQENRTKKRHVLAELP